MVATLYGHPISPYVRKVRLGLDFAGLDYQHEHLSPHSDHAEFRAASPLGKIPAYCDGEVQLADSSVILHFLARFDDGFDLMPQSKAEFAQACWFEEYADTVMTPAIAGHLFAEVVLAGRLFPRAPIQEDIDKARNEELPKIYAFLNEQLADEGWLVGEELSIADVAVGGLMLSLHHCGDTIPDTAPALQRYVEDFMSLEPVANIIAQEVEILKTMGYESPLAQRVVSE